MTSRKTLNPLMIPEFSLKLSRSNGSSPNALQMHKSMNDLPTFSSLSKAAELSLIDGEDHYKEKMKGLEEIGVFSDFFQTKQVYSHSTIDKSIKRKNTIHITDFMRKDQKMQLLMNAGGWSTYLEKKSEYEKTTLNRENMIHRFFQHSEKDPSFFSTPMLRQNYFKTPDALVKSATSRSQNKVMRIDNLIKECNMALAMKPKGLQKKAPNVKLKKLKKLKIRVLE